MNETKLSKDLMKFIPKVYKSEVKNIEKREKVWNDITKKWNTMIVVEWKDGNVSEYQNATYMNGLLKEFGR